jgi:hypothetical protein
MHTLQELLNKNFAPYVIPDSREGPLVAVVSEQGSLKLLGQVTVSRPQGITSLAIRVIHLRIA